MAIYHFLIDRRTLWGLILAGTLVGTLLFFAGLLVGLHQNLPAPTAQTRTDGEQTAAAAGTAGVTTSSRAASPSVSGPSAAGASAPTARVQASTTSTPSASVSGPHIRRPVVRRPVVRRPTVRRPTVTSGSRSASTTVTPSSEPEARRSGVSTEQGAADGTSKEADAAPAPEPAAPSAGTAVAATAEPQEPERVAPSPPPPPPPTPRAYSIQVGAYRESGYLEAALEDLRTRGYSPYVVPITGSGGLVFRTIRIGRYRTREEAVRAADEFHHRESMTALVREVTPEMRLSHLPDESPAAEPPPNVGL